MTLECKRVVLVGFSFGGGLALDCAARNRNVAGVVAICPPLRLNDFSSYFAPSLAIWNRLMDAVHYQKGKRQFIDITPEHPDINYHRLPVASLVALEQFMSGLEAQLPNIRTPALIIQSKGDPVVDPEGARVLFERLGSPQKGFRLFDIARHGILMGEGAGTVHSAIGEFIAMVQRIP
jgi:esterase/lipase